MLLCMPLQWSTVIFNTLQGDKIQRCPKFKTIADDKINFTQRINCLFRGVQNIVKREKMLVTAIFHFPSMFSDGFFFFPLGASKVVIVIIRVYQLDP